MIDSDPAQVLNEYNIPSTVLDELLSNIKRRLTPQILKIRADIEVTCYAYEGSFLPPALLTPYFIY